MGCIIYVRIDQKNIIARHIYSINFDLGFLLGRKITFKIKNTDQGRGDSYISFNVR